MDATKTTQTQESWAGLSPAPWVVVFGAGGGGGEFPYLPERSIEQAKIDAKFIELSRQAYDVMMRRRWGVAESNVVPGLWLAIVSFTSLPEGHPLEVQFRSKRWDNPFTALVESDRWFSEHVDGK